MLSFLPTSTVVGLFLLAAILCCVFVRSALRRVRLVNRINDARGFFSFVEAERALPSVQTSAILKRDETAFFVAPANLYESRAVREYQSGSAGVRLMKGVYIGQTRGRSISRDQTTLIDRGVLTLTSQRLIFDGRQTDRTVALGKIVGMDNADTFLEVSSESRQKSMLFELDNAIIAGLVLKTCCSVDDPLNMRNDTFNVQLDAPHKYGFAAVVMVLSLIIMALSVLEFVQRAKNGHVVENSVAEPQVGFEAEAAALSRLPAIPLFKEPIKASRVPYELGLANTAQAGSPEWRSNGDGWYALAKVVTKAGNGAGEQENNITCMHSSKSKNAIEQVRWTANVFASESPPITLPKFKQCCLEYVKHLGIPPPLELFLNVDPAKGQSFSTPEARYELKHEKYRIGEGWTFEIRSN